MRITAQTQHWQFDKIVREKGNFFFGWSVGCFVFVVVYLRVRALLLIIIFFVSSIYLTERITLKFQEVHFANFTAQATFSTLWHICRKCLIGMEDENFECAVGPKLLHVEYWIFYLVFIALRMATFLYGLLSFLLIWCLLWACEQTKLALLTS